MVVKSCFLCGVVIDYLAVPDKHRRQNPVHLAKVFINMRLVVKTGGVGDIIQIFAERHTFNRRPQFQPNVVATNGKVCFVFEDVR